MFNKMTALIALLKKIIQLRTWQIQYHRFCSAAPRQSTKLFG